MNKIGQLQFTGNWFIDAGILGFVNLMEEIYGDVWKEEWKRKNPNKGEWEFKFLEYLKEKTEENEELVYYGYFPFAYFVKWLKDKDREILIEKNLTKNLVETFKNKEFKSPKEILEYIWFSFICRLFENYWVSNKNFKMLYTKDLYDRKHKLKPDFNFREFDIIFPEFKKREQLVENLLKERQSEIKNLLSKRQEVRKLKRDEYEKIINFKREDLESLELSQKEKENLVEKFQKLQKVDKKIKEFLKNLWRKNVLNRKFNKEEERFYRIPIDSGFYKNFLFFNNSEGNFTQKDLLYKMISFDKKINMLDKLDKTINKFLPSEDEFSNINYTKFSTKPFKVLVKYFFVYLLCFIHAFENFKNIGNILFYSPDLKFTYLVNMKLRKRKKRIEDRKKITFDTIFRATWSEVINTLVEYKSNWSLENMYLIQYRRLDNQAQKDVEYIGIPKLQATLLLDDHIRYLLNVNLQVHGKNIWLLEEFIKGKPLYPLALERVKLRLTENKNTKISSSIFWSLLIEASILEFKKEKRRKSIFDSQFFENNYREILKEVKRNFQSLYFYFHQFKNKVSDGTIKEKLAYLLLDALYGNDKNKFLYILLKFVNSRNFDKKFLNKIFNYIVKKKNLWKNYGLFLVASMEE